MEIDTSTVTVDVIYFGGQNILKYSFKSLRCRLYRALRPATDNGKIWKFLNSPGVYLHINRASPVGLGGPTVYVGQTEDMERRTKEHGREDDWDWTEMFLFTVDDSTPGLRLALEARLITAFRNEPMWAVRNDLSRSSSVCESGEGRLADDYAALAMRLLYVAGIGSREIEGRPTSVQTDLSRVRDTKPALRPVTTVAFTLGDPGHPLATAESEGKGITVKAGSMAMRPGNMSDSHLRIRRELVKDKVISRNRFARDFTFDSPTKAAAIVCGRKTGGHDVWRDSEGRAFKEVFPPKRREGRAGVTLYGQPRDGRRRCPSRFDISLGRISSNRPRSGTGPALGCNETGSRGSPAPHLPS